MSGLNILDETTMDAFFGSFEHDADASLSDVSIINTIFDAEIGGTPASITN